MRWVTDASSIVEPTGTTAFALLTVSRIGRAAGSGDVTVSYQTQDGTATVADGDYPAQAGNVTILDGHVTAVVPVRVNDDDDFIVRAPPWAVVFATCLATDTPLPNARPRSSRTSG